MRLQTRSEAAISVPDPADALKGKAVLVTGGTTGIGRAIAIELASQGARLFVFGRHKQPLDDALNDIRAYDPDARGMVADASKAADVKRVMAAFKQALGDIDILIANAGIGADALADAGEEQWRYAIETDLLGYLAFAHAAAPIMSARQGGDIILIGSISADTQGKDGSIYVAAKAGIQAFAQSFSKEMAEHNVRVGLIEPGTVGSDMLGAPQPQRSKIAKNEMLKAEDIAVCVRFMLSLPARVNIASAKIIPLLQNHGG